MAKVEFKQAETIMDNLIQVCTIDELSTRHLGGNSLNEGDEFIIINGLVKKPVAFKGADGMPLYSKGFKSYKKLSNGSYREGVFSLNQVIGSVYPVNSRGEVEVKPLAFADFYEALEGIFGKDASNDAQCKVTVEKKVSAIRKAFGSQETEAFNIYTFKFETL